MNKVLVKLLVPLIEEEYDVWIPINKKIYRVIELLIKAVHELSSGVYAPTEVPMLYDRITAKEFDINLTVKDNDIKNGSQIVLI